MPHFSTRSRNKLAECHEDLQKLFNIVIKTYDCTVICGYRGRLAQDDLFHEGKTKLCFPSSLHNIQPSMAIDVCPYPIMWDRFDRFLHFNGFVKGLAVSMGIKIRQGIDWKGENKFDSGFIDAVHYEIIH